MSNESVRREAKKARVALWELADALGISESTITRKLRKELETSEKEKLIATIKSISESKNVRADTIKKGDT